MDAPSIVCPASFGRNALEQRVVPHSAWVPKIFTHPECVPRGRNVHRYPSWLVAVGNQRRHLGRNPIRIAAPGGHVVRLNKAPDVFRRSRITLVAICRNRIHAGVRSVTVLEMITYGVDSVSAVSPYAFRTLLNWRMIIGGTKSWASFRARCAAVSRKSFGPRARKIVECSPLISFAGLPFVK